MKTLNRYAALLLLSGVSWAQAPQWTVVVTPTLNPLPIGMCGAVHLTLLDPVTRDVPRNPQGYRINMADFDLTVSGASAAGHQIDATHFETCGCQGGAAGSTATVTATYPAQSLPGAKRVPGVSIQQSANFTLAQPKGPVNPPSCVTLASTAGNSTPAAVNPTTVSNTVPGGIAPGGTRTPTSSPTTPPPAPVTTGAATPTTNSPMASMPPTARTPGAVASTTPPPAAAAPVPVNPKNATAFIGGGGDVLLMWDPVPDASFYVVFGPGLTPGGQRVENTTKLFTWFNISRMTVQVQATGISDGTHEWLVASYYSPGNISTSAAEYSKISVAINVPAGGANPPTASESTPTATPAPVTSGNYLVTLTGIRSYQASRDDMLSRDGMGDEIYAAAYVRHYNRSSGELLDVATRQSASHGDVTNFGNQRLQAGSRTQTGGIQDGDMIPGPALITTRNAPAHEVTFPLRLWNGTLTDGVDAIIITPSLWEQDGSDAFYAKWLQFQQSLSLSLFVKQGVQDQISQKAFGPLVFGMSGNDANAGGSSVARTIVDVVMMFGGGGVPIVGLLATSADRPLGIVQSGRDQTALPNHTLVLTREIIEAALAQPPLGGIPSPVANLQSGGYTAGGVPPIARIGVVSPKPGIVVIQFQDRDVSGTLAFPERPAIYQMYIQVERVP